ncbi:MAG: 1-deoxy-D-xylulose-5-phosphate reductoisomerase [Bacilli bacterium]|nr:1-deoxy-D-xylulose-5-phosphate reductoisomerase [Bacilli bacterium]
MKRIILLGASGNVGTQVLSVLAKNKQIYCLVAISVGEYNPIAIIDNIVSRFESIKFICVRSKKYINYLQNKYKNINFYYGYKGLKTIIIDSNPDVFFNALSGFVGLMPTLTAISKNIIIILANKESLVVGGSLIKKKLKNSKSIIYPVDSEHSAIFKCLKKTKISDVKKIIITASGGAFKHLSRNQLKNVSVEQALKHPTWNMGPKITIDSATMINKGFEVIEAYYLFDFCVEKIEILMHEESFVHAIIEIKDGLFFGEVNKPTMLNPIGYALGLKTNVTIKKVDKIEKLGKFHFYKFNKNRFPMVQYVLKAFKLGGAMLCVVNAANEIAVQAFLQKKIKFLDIEKIVCLSLIKFKDMAKLNLNLSNLNKVDKIVRTWAKTIITA